MATSSETPPSHISSPWRHALRNSVASLLFEAGFLASDNLALESLTEMVQSFIGEAGHMCGALAELSGRTKVMPSDAVMALLEMGVDMTKLPGYAKRDSKSVVPQPTQGPSPPQSRILQVGDKRKHPTHIPDHLPSFPDPHTYIKTACFKQPANEYQMVREKAASQKRDVEVALTRFIAKTGTTHSLFKDDPSAFPLIASKPSPLPYLSALLPTDVSLTLEEGKEPESSSLHQHRSQHLASALGGDSSGEAQPDTDAIDNPYLLPAKIVKKSWR